MKIKSFIIFIVAVIVIVGGLGLYFANKPGKPSKYDQFAQTLTEKGAKFYGAFWCVHCQSQKEAFGSAKKYLPYVECSNTDNSTTKICEEKQIESYPTWQFKDGIKITSSDEPLICPARKDGDILEGICANASSKYNRTWIFGGYNFSIKSPFDPIKNGDVWEFPSEAQTTGELPLTFLAEQIQFTLPQ